MRYRDCLLLFGINTCFTMAAATPSPSREYLRGRIKAEIPQSASFAVAGGICYQYHKRIPCCVGIFEFKHFRCDKDHNYNRARLTFTPLMLRCMIAQECCLAFTPCTINGLSSKQEILKTPEIQWSDAVQIQLNTKPVYLGCSYQFDLRSLVPLLFGGDRKIVQNIQCMFKYRFSHLASICHCPALSNIEFKVGAYFALSKTTAMYSPKGHEDKDSPREKRGSLTLGYSPFPLLSFQGGLHIAPAFKQKCSIAFSFSIAPRLGRAGRELFSKNSRRQLFAPSKNRLYFGLPAYEAGYS